MIFDLPPPDPSLEVSVASRGYSKGLAQTDGMQVLIRPEVAFGSLRLGAYGKNITSNQYDGEAGASVGYRKSFGKLELGASATVKHLYGADPDVDDVALELNFAASRSWGALKPRVGRQRSWPFRDRGASGNSTLQNNRVEFEALSPAP